MTKFLSLVMRCRTVDSRSHQQLAGRTKMDPHFIICWMIR